MTGWTRDQLLGHTMSYIGLLAEGVRKNRLYEQYGRGNSVIVGSRALERAGVKIGGFKSGTSRTKHPHRDPD